MQRAIDPRILARIDLYSQVLYRELKDHVQPRRGHADLIHQQRWVRRAVDDALHRLIREPRVQRPERLLLREVRHCFAMSHLPRVVLAINETVSAALGFLDTPECRELLTGRCLAVTRSGDQCRRPPVTGEEFCPSHRHLREAKTVRPQRGALADRELLAPVERAVA